MESWLSDRKCETVGVSEIELNRDRRLIGFSELWYASVTCSDVVSSTV